MRGLINWLADLSRAKKIALQYVADAILIALAFGAAMTIRLEQVTFLSQVSFWFVLAICVLATLIALSLFGLYHSLVRYLTGKIMLIIARAAIVSALALYIAAFALDAFLPRSVPLIHMVLMLLFIGGLRFAARQIFRRPDQINRRPIIIYGAGDSGRQLLNSLYHGREYTPVAFVDDDKSLQNLTIGGLSVFSPDEIEKLVRETGAVALLLATTKMTRARRREIVERLEGLKLEIKRIPGMNDIVSGKAKISELRDVTAEDLLGRDPVAPDIALMEHNISGKTVMVSGAGGSIGSELCRQILAQEPNALILYEVSEYALYAIEAELKEATERSGLAVRIIPILGSVQHVNRLEKAISSFNVQTIYHAAAYKHVPLVEENVIEGVRNNVFGTLAIALAARKLGVENFILISTDKAVRPTNVMGTTKRIAELVCQAQAKEEGDTCFSMVRFGNVLGSSGSVIPRFRKQIEAGGPITVTHAEINRYFMTIPEAAQLVIQAGAMAKGGDVFVLDMGEPVKIMDLATSMVKLHGLEPYLVDHIEDQFPDKGDIAICVTGLRKGEKLYEELLIGNNPEPTAHKRIMTASEISLPFDELSTHLDRLLKACEQFDVPAILDILRELPVDYSPTNPVPSDLLWTMEHKTVDA